MKKIIFIFLLILLPFLVKGQTTVNQYPHPSSIPTINITIDQNNGWAVTGQTCAGCASFFYQILRSSQMHPSNDGYNYYYYYFIFYSNSYYPNGNQANTYLTNAKFYLNGSLVTNQNYILLERGTQKFVAWIRNQNSMSAATFHIDQITVY